MATQSSKPAVSETSGADVIDLTTGMSAEVTQFLTDEVLSNNRILRQLNEIAQQAQQLSAAGLDKISVTELDGSLLGAGSIDDRLALAELQGGLAKHGLTPLNTVEGLVKLREALVTAYKDNQIVPVETRLKAAELTTQLYTVEAVREHVITAERIRAETAALRANAEATIATIDADLVIEEAGAQAKIRRVAVKSISTSADIDGDLLRRKKQNEYLAKVIATYHERRKVLWHGIGQPVTKAGLMILIPLIVISNLVSDAPQHAHAFVLGSINHEWDKIYMPLRDGIIRVIHEFQHKASR